MNWTQPVWLYCERGRAEGLTAEPVNLVSGLAFVLAALGALWVYRGLSHMRRSPDHLLLIGLAALVGVGSMLFHAFADQRSELADMVPIFAFLTVYLVHVLDRLLGLPPGLAAFVALVFVALTLAGATMTCGWLDAFMQPDWAKGATACLNGSLAYVPALVILFVVAHFAGRRGNRAAGPLRLAGALFAGALVLRSVDHLTCGLSAVAGHAIGSHAAWHLVTALAMFVLLRAAMLHQNLPPVQEILPPPRSDSVGGA